ATRRSASHACTAANTPFVTARTASGASPLPCAQGNSTASGTAVTPDSTALLNAARSSNTGTASSRPNLSGLSGPSTARPGPVGADPVRPDSDTHSMLNSNL